MPDGGPEQFAVVGSRTACYPVVKRRGVPDSVSACVRVAVVVSTVGCLLPTNERRLWRACVRENGVSGRRSSSSEGLSERCLLRDDRSVRRRQWASVRRRFKELVLSFTRRPACSFCFRLVTTVDLPSRLRRPSTSSSSRVCVFER